MIHNTRLLEVRLMKKNANCFDADVESIEIPDEDLRSNYDMLPKVIVFKGVYYCFNRRKVVNGTRWLYTEVPACFLEDNEE